MRTKLEGSRGKIRSKRKVAYERNEALENQKVELLSCFK